MYFPVSGVEINPLLPPLVAFVVSAVTSTAGIAGAFLLLPYQVSVLGFTSPSVSPTNLIYNIIAVPGGLYRYIREGRMAWHLTWLFVLGALPGMFAGAWIRVKYLPDPRNFKLFMGAVLLYLGIRLLREILICRNDDNRVSGIEKKFKDRVSSVKGETGAKIVPGLPPGITVEIKRFSLNGVEYEFWGETFAFKPAAVFGLALVVGLIGGIYGLGGGAILAPICVSFFGLPVYIIAGAVLAVNLFTSAAGVVFFSFFASTPVGAHTSVAPDWALGILFGAGGFFGTYLGARLQKFLPERLVRVVLGVLVSSLAVRYILQYYLK